MKENVLFIKLRIALLFSVLGFFAINAQQGTGAQSAAADDIGPSSYEVQKIPPAPEAASLGNYGNVPINKYNGTANVSVPIYAVGLDNLSLPLTASYNTGGIRVGQDATWVGLGWNLTTGVSITREINGFDDLRGLAYTGNIIPGDVGKENLGWIFSSSDYLYYDNASGKNRISGEDLEFLDNDNWQNNYPIDLQPDLFTVNTPNGSCKFYLPKKGSSNELVAQIANNVNFKVVYNTDDYTFKVTDPDGYHYTFNYIELSTGFRTWETWSNEEDSLDAMSPWPTNQTKYTMTAWKPGKIRSPMGRELTFEYEAGHHFSFPSFQETFSTNITSNQSQNQGWHAATEVNINSPATVSASINAFHNYYLKKIEGDFGEVVFNLGNERLDLFSKDAYYALTGNFGWVPLINASTEFKARRLNGITVFNNLGEPIRTANFEYSYFNENQIGQTVKERYLRLKLDKVSINDQEYAFSYIECNSLPAKDSRAVDFWGYYNGANTNSHRIPSSNRFYFSYPTAINNNKGHDQFYKFSTTVDRGSNSNYARYGTLNKVRYPTKGVTEYIYEGNSVALDRKDYKNNSNYDALFGGGGVRVSLWSSVDYNFRYQYLKLQDSAAYSLYDYVDNNDIPIRYVEEFEVGGLRVTEVLDKDYDGTTKLRRAFEYEESNNGGIYSSGRLMDDLIFHSKGIGNTWENTPENYADNNLITLYSDNMLRTSMSAAGSHIGYTRVIEKSVDSQGIANGRTETLYHNRSNEPKTREILCTPFFTTGSQAGHSCQGTYDCWDAIDDCSDYAPIFGVSNMKLTSGPVYIMTLSQKTYEHQNGKPRQEYVYNTENVRVSETQSTYEEVSRNGSTAPLFPLMNWYQNGQAQLFPIGFPYDVIDGNSFGLNKEFRLKTSTTTQHFDSESISSSIDYTYGVHNQLIKVESLNSKGELRTTKAYYPQDLSGEAFMNKLIDSNRTRIRVKSEVYYGTSANPESDLLASQHTTYNDAKNVSGIVLPDEVYTLKGEATISKQEETRQIYELYDDLGNLVQYRKESGIPVTFIWGHNKQYVVAKIDNATYEDVKNILGANYDLGANGLTESQMSGLRNGLSNGMVTTFTYKPIIGILSMTDPRGYTTNYVYDDQNRLKEVRDSNNNLIQDYQYKFISATSND